jgi:hypothetical protein
MRGPLLSGPIGSASALARLAALLQPPVVVLSSVWLAAELATETPVVLLVEPDAVKAARRAQRKAQEAGRRLLVVTAGEAVPLAAGSVGALVVEGLSEVEERAALDFLQSLAPVLGPAARLVALDNTKDPAIEARLAGLFLAAGLRHITQERPKEGALLTVADAPAAALIAARRRG